MSTTLITENIWPQITKAVREAKQPCAAAVAYFGKGAAKLLPLRKRHRLVVDASEGAVKSGQTHPLDLLALVNKDVRVFTVPNLHAKVFVIGRAAYVGSNNVSSRSASQLVEATIRTTETAVVESAKKFIEAQCLHELTPEMLKQLTKLYRPPQISGLRPKRSEKDQSPRPTIPRLHLLQLELQDWPANEDSIHEAALKVAEKRREHPRSYILDYFRWAGGSSIKRGDVAIQVTDEGATGVWVSPPANVLHVRSFRTSHGNASLVYVELPNRPRRRLKRLAQKLGYGAQKKLQTQGVVRNRNFAQALLRAWAG